MGKGDERERGRSLAQVKSEGGVQSRRPRRDPPPPISRGEVQRTAAGFRSARRFSLAATSPEVGHFRRKQRYLARTAPVAGCYCRSDGSHCDHAVQSLEQPQAPPGPPPPRGDPGRDLFSRPRPRPALRLPLTRFQPKALNSDNRLLITKACTPRCSG